MRWTPLCRFGASALLAAGVLCALTPAAVGDVERLSRERQQEIVNAALSAYDEAVSIARQDPTRARALYQDAANSWLALVEAGVQNAALEYDLGNVFFRLGDLGHAILHYRRAQRLNPTDARLEANLRYARERVEPLIPPSAESRLLAQLLFWHHRTSVLGRFKALVALAAIGWLILSAWLWIRRSGVLLAGLIVVALSLAVGASIHWQLYDEAAAPHAVIVRDLQYLRLGRGEGSDLALKQPLGAGVELRVLDRRGDWIEVRLPNEQTGWLPADAVELV